MAPFTLYFDMLSQPCRATYIFCKANSLEMEEAVTSIIAGEHHMPKFQGKFPLGLLPTLQDGELLLGESHAIMKYLVATRDCAEHWYPSDPAARARVDMLLDWHHTHLRRGCTVLVQQSWLNPLRGEPVSEDIRDNARKQLEHAVATMEATWLAPDVAFGAGAGEGGPFLLGAKEPSLADLAMAAEMQQVRLLGSKEFQILVLSSPRVAAWLAAAEAALQPHFGDAHKTLDAVAANRDEEIRLEAEQQ